MSILSEIQTEAQIEVLEQLLSDMEDNFKAADHKWSRGDFLHWIEDKLEELRNVIHNT